jgi:hypothetical protein
MKRLHRACVCRCIIITTIKTNNTILRKKTHSALASLAVSAHEEEVVLILMVI